MHTLCPHDAAVKKNRDPHEHITHELRKLRRTARAEHGQFCCVRILRLDNSRIHRSARPGFDFRNGLQFPARWL